MEIIANDQDNRTTPSYVSFSNTERLIGDAAKNQVAMNPHNTCVCVVLLYSLQHKSQRSPALTTTKAYGMYGLPSTQLTIIEPPQPAAGLGSAPVNRELGHCSRPEGNTEEMVDPVGSRRRGRPAGRISN